VQQLIILSIQHILRCSGGYVRITPGNKRFEVEDIDLRFGP
jgi:hypothetical protein